MQNGVKNSKGGVILKLLKYKKTISAALLAAFLLSGCNSGTAETTPVTTTTAAPETTVPVTTAAAIADEEERPAEEKPGKLTVALNESNYLYTPFDVTNSFDSFMNTITGVSIMEKDRSGKPVLKGTGSDRTEYGGRYYTYSGAADVTTEYDEEIGTTLCNIKLREGIKFSDGESLTADDLIFTLYVLLDPAYNGSCDLSGAGIVGAANYRLDSSIAEEISAEEIEEALETEEVKALIHEKIIVPTINKLYENVISLYGDSSYEVYTEAYPNPKDLMAYFYSIDSSYDSTLVYSPERVLADIAEMYGSNYRLLGSMYSGDADYYRNMAESVVVGYITSSKGASGNVTSISGIVKTGPLSVSITSKGSDIADHLADIVIAPLHYYGDESLYSYGDCKYGFEKGTADKILEKNAGLPLGAGAYSFEKSENGTVYLSANELYYKGKPEIPEICVINGTESDAEEAVSEGRADISYPSGSKESLSEIEAANQAIEKIYLGAGKTDGYGYIGINAAAVNIGGEPLSEQSIMLRKGIATAIAFFKENSVADYYGESGETVSYPVCRNYSAAPTDLPEPYSLDVNGEPILTEEMNVSERYSAVKAACLGYFEAAGYTVEDGKITAAPEGGKLEFTAIVAGGGKGSHPSFTALNDGASLLSVLGIKITVKDTADISRIWEVLSSGTQEIWAGAWDDNLSTMYSETGANYYGIKDSNLEKLIQTAESSADPEEAKQAYSEVFNTVVNRYAAEIPVYRKVSRTLFSTLRIDVSTLPESMTGYYGWAEEAEKLKLRK